MVPRKVTPALALALAANAMPATKKSEAELRFEQHRLEVEAAFAKAFEGCNYGDEETRDAKYWFSEGYNSAPTGPDLTLETYKPNSVNNNSCHEQAIRALRYLGRYGRTPDGGNAFPNDECCLMIADELEAAWRTIHKALSNKPLCPECKDTGMRDHGGTYPWGEYITVPCDCGMQP